MIYESLEAVWAVECNYHSRQQFVDDFCVPRGFFGQSNPSITRDGISLMIYESLGAVWAVESNYHP